MRTLQVIAATAFLVGMTSGVMAQQPQAAQPAPAPAPPIPAVGDAAPDFSFTPIDRSGIAQAPKKLSDYRGQAVVLWFFIKARTRG